MMGLFKSLFKMTPIGAVYWSIRDSKREAKEARKQVAASLSQVAQQRSLLEKTLSDATASSVSRVKRRSSPFSRSLLRNTESSMEMNSMKQTLGA